MNVSVSAVTPCGLFFLQTVLGDRTFKGRGNLRPMPCGNVVSAVLKHGEHGAKVKTASAFVKTMTAFTKTKAAFAKTMPLFDVFEM